MLTAFFWSFALLTVYAYLGYPLIITVLGIRRSREARYHTSDEFPRVSFIISARNEEKNIRRKLQNTLALDYPRERLEILVASNGSADRTDAIATDFASQGAKLISIQEPGKTHAQNLAVAQAQNDIVVFSDADATYRGDALLQLVAPFQDHRIAAVLGKVVWEESTTSMVREGESLYWRYENYLKRRESRLGACLAGSGAIMALRRELYEPLEPHLMEDFAIPVIARAKGYKVVFRPSAIASHATAEGGRAQFQRKARVILQDVRAFFDLLPRLLRPTRAFLLWQLISHKLVRWLVPFFLLGLLATSAALAELPLFAAVLGLQLAFYLMALIGYLAERLKMPKALPLYVPYYFCLVNTAAFVALLMAASGRRMPSWGKATAPQEEGA